MIESAEGVAAGQTMAAVLAKSQGLQKHYIFCMK